MKLINFRQIDGGMSLVAKVKELSAYNVYTTTLVNALKQTVFPVKEKIDLSDFDDPKSPATEFVLTNQPASQDVELFINGIMYEEGDAFEVNRAEKKITWVFNSTANGFDLYNEVTDAMTAKYFINVVADKKLKHKVILNQTIPTEGTFVEGDIVLRSQADKENKIGWIYKANEEDATLFEWIEIDIYFLEKLLEEAAKLPDEPEESEEPKTDEEKLPYVTFETDSADKQIELQATKTWDGKLEYSYDTKNWTEWDGSTITSTDGKLYLRGVNNTIISDDVPFVVREV